MGRYSHTDLVGKFLSYGALLKELNLPYLIEYAPVNVLFMVRVINDRGLPCHILALSISLGINKRANGRPFILSCLNDFITAGYIEKRGMNYYITEGGRTALTEIERGLRRVMVRVRVSDPLLGNLTGPRKGVSMPKRWPDK
jgi:hypothetical protein